MSRFIALEHETTGMSPEDAKLIEVAAVEIIDNEMTGRSFHKLVNPGVSVPTEVAKITGIHDDLLAPAPYFTEVADQLTHFIGESKIVVHWAGFTAVLFQAQLKRNSYKPYENERFVDVITLAVDEESEEPRNLDALAKRFGVPRPAECQASPDLLKDAECLANVFVSVSKLTASRR